MQGTRGGNTNIRARSTVLSKRRVLAVALCLGLVAGLILSSTASASAITEFTVPTGDSYPAGITAGPDGNIWFTEVSGNQIGRIILVDPI